MEKTPPPGPVAPSRSPGKRKLRPVVGIVMLLALVIGLVVGAAIYFGLQRPESKPPPEPTPQPSAKPTATAVVTPSPTITATPPDGQPASTEVRAAIRKCYDRLSEAAAKNDLQAFKAVHSGDFVSRDGANVDNAETYFSAAQLLFAVGTQITYDIKDVRTTGSDTAVVTVKIERKLPGMSATMVETDSETWKRIGDQWLRKESNTIRDRSISGA